MHASKCTFFRDLPSVCAPPPPPPAPQLSARPTQPAHPGASVGRLGVIVEVTMAITPQKVNCAHPAATSPRALLHLLGVAASSRPHAVPPPLDPQAVRRTTREMTYRDFAEQASAQAPPGDCEGAGHDTSALLLDRPPAGASQHLPHPLISTGTATAADQASPGRVRFLQGPGRQERHACRALPGKGGCQVLPGGGTRAAAWLWPLPGSCSCRMHDQQCSNPLLVHATCLAHDPMYAARHLPARCSLMRHTRSWRCPGIAGAGGASVASRLPASKANALTLPASATPASLAWPSLPARSATVLRTDFAYLEKEPAFVLLNAFPADGEPGVQVGVWPLGWVGGWAGGCVCVGGWGVLPCMHTAGMEQCRAKWHRRQAGTRRWPRPCCACCERRLWPPLVLPPPPPLQAMSGPQSSVGPQAEKPAVRGTDRILSGARTWSTFYLSQARRRLVLCSARCSMLQSCCVVVHRVGGWVAGWAAAQEAPRPAVLQARLQQLLLAPFS